MSITNLQQELRNVKKINADLMEQVKLLKVKIKKLEDGIAASSQESNHSDQADASCNVPFHHQSLESSSAGVSENKKISEDTTSKKRNRLFGE